MNFGDVSTFSGNNPSAFGSSPNREQNSMQMPSDFPGGEMPDFP